jgi:hypothetical protein
MVTCSSGELVRRYLKVVFRVATDVEHRHAATRGGLRDPFSRTRRMGSSRRWQGMPRRTYILGLGLGIHFDFCSFSKKTYSIRTKNIPLLLIVQEILWIEKPSIA